MSNTLLQMIANPTVADVGGRYNQGKDDARRRQLADIALANNQEDRIFNKDMQTNRLDLAKQGVGIQKQNQQFKLDKLDIERANETKKTELFSKLTTALSANDEAGQRNALIAIAQVDPRAVSAIVNIIKSPKNTHTSKIKEFLWMNEGNIKKAQSALSEHYNKKVDGTDKGFISAGTYTGVDSESQPVVGVTSFNKNTGRSAIKFMRSDNTDAVGKVTLTDKMAQTPKAKSAMSIATEKQKKIDSLNAELGLGSEVVTKHEEAKLQVQNRLKPLIAGNVAEEVAKVEQEYKPETARLTSEAQAEIANTWGPKTAAATAKAIAEVAAEYDPVAAYENTKATMQARIAYEPKLKAKMLLTDQSVAKSGEYFAQTDAIRTELGKLQKAFDIMEDGANTGPIATKWTPTLRNATIRLEQVQAELGLEVIRNTTFGPLSKQELEFSLRTAIPTELTPKALKVWIKETMEAKEKMAVETEKAAMFLSSENPKTGHLNTIRDWKQLQADRKQGNTSRNPDGTKALEPGATVELTDPGGLRE